MTSTGDQSTQWERFCRILEDEVLPAAVVDLDALDRNIDQLLGPVRSAGKRLRLASKSVRCVALLQYITNRSAGTIHGLMTYTAGETKHLAAAGFTDLLLAYPTVRRREVEDLVEVNQAGATAAVVADSLEQLEAMERIAAARGGVLPIVIEVDLAYRPFGDLAYIGVRRSPLRTVGSVVDLAERVREFKHLRFDGVMGYEAHIAGLPDNNPFAPSLNLPKHWIRLRARPRVEETRSALAAELNRRGFSPRIINGGGTGSLAWCTGESALTEVTAGSGFLDSHLFDYYRGLRLEPAAGFALQVVRRPCDDMVTCHGGGYIASGGAGPDRLPIPWLPAGLALLPAEGAGEVQTPLKVRDGLRIKLGDAILFRHAKAGELAEHFREYLLVRGDKLESRVLTYRGEGQHFLG